MEQEIKKRGRPVGSKDKEPRNISKPREPKPPKPPREPKDPKNRAKVGKKPIYTIEERMEHLRVYCKNYTANKKRTDSEYKKKYNEYMKAYYRKKKEERKIEERKIEEGKNNILDLLSAK